MINFINKKSKNIILYNNNNNKKDYIYKLIKLNNNVNYISYSIFYKKDNKIKAEIMPFSFDNDFFETSDITDITSEIYKINSSFLLKKPPLLKAVLFLKSNILFIGIHHLVVDGVSWRIILEDLTTAYLLLKSKKPVQLPEKTLSFKKWSDNIVKYSKSEKLISEKPFWCNKNYDVFIPCDYTFKPEKNIVLSAENINLSLPKDKTDLLLNKIQSVYHTQINDILLTALVLAVSKWTNKDKLFINLKK